MSEPVERRPDADDALSPESGLMAEPAESPATETGEPGADPSPIPHAAESRITIPTNTPTEGRRVRGESVPVQMGPQTGSHVEVGDGAQEPGRYQDRDTEEGERGNRWGSQGLPRLPPDPRLTGPPPTQSARAPNPARAPVDAREEEREDRGRPSGLLPFPDLRPYEQAERQQEAERQERIARLKEHAGAWRVTGPLAAGASRERSPALERGGEARPAAPLKPDGPRATRVPLRRPAGGSPAA